MTLSGMREGAMQQTLHPAGRASLGPSTEIKDTRLTSTESGVLIPSPSCLLLRIIFYSSVINVLLPLPKIDP